MGWGYGDRYPAYVPVAKKRLNAEKAAKKLAKGGQKLSPIHLAGSKIATSYWGKAWCQHLESFSDYANRLPRGRSYLRQGAVLDLKIENGKVSALVQGSETYKVSIGITVLGEQKWQAIRARCAGEIASVIELLQGKLSASVMHTVTDQKDGLFPLPGEIKLQCSCPDWAEMCKHVAAALYGIGARLDQEPELLFTLRNVDHLQLISAATLSTTAKTPQKGLEGQDLSALFGIDMDEAAPAEPKAKAKAKAKPVAKKKPSSLPAKKPQRRKAASLGGKS